jgi:spermidine synthase
MLLRVWLRVQNLTITETESGPFLGKRYEILSLFFFFSGFCALLYQLVFLRLAFSAFGVITPVVSLVLSIFMCGLGLGAWLGGKAIGPLKARTRTTALVWYGLAEIFIGLSAFAVPASFSLSEKILLTAGESNSLQYLLLTAFCLAISLLPWTLIMGTTFVLGMAFLREFPEPNKRTFGLLYAANVCGAVVGTCCTAFVLIEIFGFHGTLYVGAVLNFLIGAAALTLGLQIKSPAISTAVNSVTGSDDASVSASLTSKLKHSCFLTYFILFSTGFATMAMEVVWMRAFTKLLGNQVYSFATLLVVYLFSTTIGCLLYKEDSVKKSIRESKDILLWAALFAFFPVIASDPRLHMPGLLAVTFAVLPFSGVIGYLTPMLIDDFAQGDEELAGRAYAMNVVGCVLGPLVSGYILLPMFGCKLSLILLAVPFALFAFYQTTVEKTSRSAIFAVACVALLSGSFACASWEDAAMLPPEISRKNPPRVENDYVATTMAFGEGFARQLTVNGFSMTNLEPSTKFMAHLPLIFCAKPKSVLVICFGMGTSFRSALSWDIPTTVIDLVPGVPKMFSYFYDDTEKVLKDKNAKVIVDDGRRYLSRMNEKFDVITVDPPQPLAVAGSSLLYSREFYALCKAHLNEGGIVQEYLPIVKDSKIVTSAVLRSMSKSFKYVKLYKLLGGWGYHLFASNTPFPVLTPEQMVAKLTTRELNDFSEFEGTPDKKVGLLRDIQTVLNQEENTNDILALTPDHLVMSDDRPLNEYWLMRTIFGLGILQK